MATFPPEFFQQVTLEHERLLREGLAPPGGEQDLVQAFMDTHEGGCFDERLPSQAANDVVIREYVFRYGRADIVMFHQDGTATIIEAKDGSKGYTHVVGGIGQCSLYAAQLGAKPGALNAVRRCLMWSSAGVFADVAIEDACILAGVTPLPFPAIQTLTASRAAVAIVLARGGHHGSA